MTDETMTPEQREEARNTQLGVLRSVPMRDLYVASAGRNTNKYGDMGLQATQGSYVDALRNPDESVARLLANPFLVSASNAQRAGRNPYEEGAVTPIQLLNSAEAFYLNGLGKVKVSDVLELMGSPEIPEDVLSPKQRDMYMIDFQEADVEKSQKLSSAFMQYIQMTGVGQAIANSGRNLAGSLEGILRPNEAPQTA
tara:strand:+ start:33 stop:623 length:591 start_codon:yes stop_codon:yes gene_type:complete